MDGYERQCYLYWTRRIVGALCLMWVLGWCRTGVESLTVDRLEELHLTLSSECVMVVDISGPRPIFGSFRKPCARRVEVELPLASLLGLTKRLKDIGVEEAAWFRGIGPITARRIYRHRHVASWEVLAQRGRLSEKQLQSLQSLLVISSAVN